MSVRAARVLMTADSVGGVWTFALDLAAALGRDGTGVDLAVMGAPLTPDQRAAADRIPTLTTFEGAFKLEWMEDSRESVEAAGRWLLDLERARRPEVVHLNGYVHAALPWRAPVVVTGHSCVLSWWQAVHGCPAPSSWAGYARDAGDGLRAAHTVVAPTRAMLGALRTHYGPLPPARVVANGRDASLFRPRAKRRVVLGVGRVWDAAKNLAALDRVAPRLRWPVVIAGESRHPDGGGASLQHARALGRIDAAALGRALGHAAIVALPALYEPFGLAALEAGLAGCALVLGDIASQREVWGDAACYVPPRDDAALEERLAWLIAHPRERRALAERARRCARSYTTARMGRGYAAVYAAALAQAPPAIASAAPHGGLPHARVAASPGH
jgi:glycogen synthase